MQHIGSALEQPALNLAAEAAALDSAENRTLAQHADELVKLIDDIQLANLLESDTWKTSQALFSVQELIDDVVPEVLPAMKRKGLQLLINNALPAGEQRYGDREALRRNTGAVNPVFHHHHAYRQDHLDVCQDESASDRLTFRILDTGNGVSANRSTICTSVSQRDPELICTARRTPSPSGCADRTTRANWVGS